MVLGMVTNGDGEDSDGDIDDDVDVDGDGDGHVDDGFLVAKDSGKKNGRLLCCVSANGTRCNKKSLMITMIMITTMMIMMVIMIMMMVMLMMMCWGIAT